MSNSHITSGHKCGNSRCSRTFDRNELVNPHKKFCSTSCRVEFHRDRRKAALELMEQAEALDRTISDRDTL